LLDAAPVPDPRVRRARHDREVVAANGRTDSLVSTGCPFAARCPFAVPECWTVRPTPRRTPDNSVVACHRYPEWQQETGA
jgi:hypothetical protein